MAAIDQRQPPDVEPVGANAARAAADVGTPLRGIDGRESNQPRIVHHAIGIFEGGAERPLQRVADRMVRDIDRRRGRQPRRRGQPVIEQQPRPQQPCRTLVGMFRDRKAHRTHQMRGDPQPIVALGQRPMDPKKRPAFQRRQIAMYQPRRSRRRAAAEVALLDQDDPEAASGASRATLTPFRPPPMIARS